MIPDELTQPLALPTADALELLRVGELSVEGRLVDASNATLYCAVSADGVSAACVYKPVAGERPLWDFPDGLYRREVAAFVLSEALGWGIVPPTVERDDGPLGPGSLQLFVAADYEQHYFTLFDQGGHEEALRRMCVFDIVANNADRKSGHVLLGPDGRLWGIDHGLCFHRQSKLRTVIWDFADEPVPRPLLADLERTAADLPDALAALLHDEECQAVVDRIHRLVHVRTLPEPLGDRPPYPWPLV